MINRSNIADLAVVGHRGAAASAPENTAASIGLAFREGADAVEIDVRLSADGRLVVIHDATLQRTAGLPAVVAETTAAELRRLAAVPDLDEAWEIANGRVVIEIKSDWGGGLAHRSAEALAVFLRGRDASRAVASSFEVGALDALRGSGIATGVLVFPSGDALDAVRLAVSGGHAVCYLPDAITSPDAIDAAHDAGIRVVPWTVNEPGRWIEMKRWGADGVITDDPGALRRFLDDL